MDENRRNVMSSTQANQNRVKAIRSQFEVLNEQSAGQLNPEKSNVKKLLKTPLCKFNGESRELDKLRSRNVVNQYASAKEKFGPSCNFGNRKRLKENAGEVAETSNKSFKSDDEASNSADRSSVSDNTKENESCANRAARCLSRQHSDPVKKLHRTPAFRCDRSEKMRDAHKSGLTKSPELSKPPDRTDTTKEKLKRLGSMIEERLKEDDLAFSATQSAATSISRSGRETPPSKGGNESYASGDVSETKSNYISENTAVIDIKKNDQIPQHILDMYAKVLKPKGKSGYFGKSDLLFKSDVLFSDSGVSSESENLISDELEEVENVNKSVSINTEPPKIVDVSRKSTVEEKTPDASFDSSDDNTPTNDNEINEFLKDKDLVMPGVVSVDTLKKVLKQPLPVGPPPKKPPRTFAAARPESPKKSLNDIRYKSNKTKPPRSKEESKLLLDKIENALLKHQSGGKILAPRIDKFSIADDQSTDDSFGKFDTHPSTAHLKQPPPKKPDNNEKKEVHYMCTEILDLHLKDKSHVFNSNDGSLASSEEVQPSNSFVKCLTSLNCSNNRKSAGFSYSKFGSPNPNDPSFADICCSCNESKEQKRKTSNENLNSGVRLSTFAPTNLNDFDQHEDNKCKICGLNENKDIHSFKCYLDCTCKNKADDILVLSKVSNSQFFIPNDTGQYGSLKRSKSQEHIYDEPVLLRRDNDDRASDVREMGVLTRSRTQLEDVFRKRRSSNDCAKSAIFETEFRERSGPFVRNDFRSKTVGRMRSTEKDAFKVKDILKRWEESKNVDLFDGRSGRLQKSMEAVSTTNDRYIYDTPSEVISGWQDGKRSEEQLLGSSPSSDMAEIYDFCQDSADEAEEKGESPAVFKKPPLLRDNAKKLSPSSAIIMRMKRPQHLDLNSSSRSQANKAVRGSPVDIDKQNLASLFGEIYETVSACNSQSPVENGPAQSTNKIERDFEKEYKNYENVSLKSPNKDNHEMAEASLKLSRSLTEKRKEYVKRVSRKTCHLPNRHGVQDHESRIYGIFPPNEKVQNMKMLFERGPYTAQSGVVKKKIEIPRTDQNVASVENRLFDICTVVGWNFCTGKAYIKNVFPETATLPPQFETLVFPESCDENSSGIQNNSVYRKSRCETLAEDAQFYSFVLTNEEGRRSYAYCCRVVPDGAPFCLPLAYCVIANYKAPAFYFKILTEIESHHGTSDVIIKSILNQLYNTSFPKPGYGISFKQWNDKDERSEGFDKKSFYRSSLNLGDVMKFSNKDDKSGSDSISLSESLEDLLKNNYRERRKSTDSSSKFPRTISGENGVSMMKSLEKIYSSQSVSKKDSGIKRSPNGSNAGASTSYQSDNHIDFKIKKKSSPKSLKSIESNGIITLKRAMEPCLEDENLSILFDTLHEEVLLKVFATLLLERKVILVGDKLSKLSACIEGLQSILYPFFWQHALVTAIPPNLRKMIFDIPIPILAGVFCPQVATSNNPHKKNNDPKSKTTHLKDLYDDLEESNFDEGMIIDISFNKKSAKEQIIRSQGDEATILPPNLSKTLRTTLQLGSQISTTDLHSNVRSKKTSNILVAESFLRFFTTFLGDYKTYLAINSATNQINLDKEKFIKNNPLKHVQYFLEWFTETSMFLNFVRHQTVLLTMPPTLNDSSVMDNLPYPDFYEVFDDKVTYIEYCKKHNKSDNAINRNNYKGIMNKKIKVWKEKFNNLIH